MIKTSNAEFLEAINKPSEKLAQGHEAFLWVCSKNNKGSWLGEAYIDVCSTIEDSNFNNYFCTSKVKIVDGIMARKNPNFFCLMCVVLDDVGTKITKVPELKPSWKIETSPNNEQWGYILAIPITDSTEAENLIKLVINAGYCDKGANGHVRYMRLPVGSNDKSSHVSNNGNKPYPHKLNAWNPDLRYTKQQLIEGLGLDEFVNNEKQKTKGSGVIIDVTNRESDEDLIKDIITGKSYHASTRSLAARYAGRGMKEKGIIATIQGFMHTSAIKDERWQERYNDILRLVETAEERFSSDDELPERFKLTSASDFINAPSISWIVKHILPVGGLAMIYGASGSGKSFFALDITASIARGVTWFGKKVKQGKIVYIAAEGVSGFRKRVKAYCKHHEINSDDLSFKIIEETPDLTKGNDKALITSIKDDGGADVIVIDTLAQVSAGANENSGEHMGMVLKRCQNIQKETGALVLLIHHSGKDDSKGERGWSGMRAAMDTVIKITSKKLYKVAQIDKQKDGNDNLNIPFNLKQIGLGFDEDNEPITSCVVELENPSIIEKLDLKGEIQKIIFRILNDFGEIAKEDLISSIMKDSEKSGIKRRRDAIVRAINDMRNNSYLEENLEFIRITQRHTTPKNNTCGDVAKSEILHHPTSIYKDVECGSDERI